ncbi:MULTISPECIES: NAD-dependent epimerase/dehydratase family protein [Spongiibacter]|uniref:NAD-dependent epimerase/dehydratase family protein n=1 Tax=Spongiibacter TaxID=630749 RepID=UPI000C645D22|nr:MULTISPECIES: NAD(P)-dependent oxidoreductase [Spongiibacter]MAY39862.1 epimerase [Spongiibacter sp.]MBI57414.1 epimerase [Spongiibacter sp.]|tara:strand:- start:7174 stop:8079 length:906 start_codon:yes stop_codon:yes gene_type:complete
MKVLVVGGSGLIGGDAALYLKSHGHDVTIMARSAPTAPVLAALPFVRGDYVNDDMSDGRLNRFDAVVFAAAADIRQVPMDGSVTPEDFYRKVNDEAVPRFFAAAREAGVRRAVYIGTFYPQVASHRIGECPYVTSRSNTDEAVRAMSSDSFTVCSLNLPFVMGHIPGLDIPHIGALVAYASGALSELPVFAPKGGTNHITSHAVAQATLAALDHGESGRAYLLGDENYSWKEYLELWFEAAGNPQTLEVREDDHPLLPNVIMFAGPGATVSYEPEAVEELAYDRHQINATINTLVKAYSEA